MWINLFIYLSFKFKMENLQKLRNLHKEKKLKFSKAEPTKTKANDAIFISIINTADEFKNILNHINIDSHLCFNPKFTNQIFGDDEMIIGYKDIKINIYLTPIEWNPLFQITYSKKEDNCEKDIETYLIEFFGEYYHNDIEKFENQLKNEEELMRNGIFNNEFHMIDENIQENKKIFLFTVYERHRKNKIHTNLQSLITFFIDGASEIPLQYNSWNYYLIYSNNQLIGFSTLARFHMSIYIYRAMLSQFFIYPAFQRKGNGECLLSAIYNQELKNNKCIDFSIEDPAQEFISLRDVVLYKELLPYFKNRIDNKVKINSIEEYLRIKINDDELFSVCKTLKLSKILIKRYELLFKYIISSGNKELEEELFKDINEYLVMLNKDAFISPNEGRHPIIDINDKFNDAAINAEEILKQEVNPTEEDMIQRLQESLDEFMKDFIDIKIKCSKYLKKSN